MIIDEGQLASALAGFASDSWINDLLELSREKMTSGAHGDLPRWRTALDGLPAVSQASLHIEDGTVAALVDITSEQAAQIRQKLMSLIPWRKGPFQIDDVLIDAEWRSDMKWDRISTARSSLSGRRILDVGCGNGYYALRMRAEGANLVLGVDPTLLFIVQCAVITRFLEPVPVFTLPLRLHELPAGGPQFDTVFSMGVLYHQRRPHEHLEQLGALLAADGELVLETLIIPGERKDILVPESLYARMRNVWHLPTAPQLDEWLRQAGFQDVRIADATPTTVEEQRTTEWMPFESLCDALDADDASLTVEGLPAPLRVVAVAAKAD